MGDIQIHCKYDALIEVNKLKAYKKNRNQHTTAQVERLAKILEYQGLRQPVVVVGNVAGVYNGKTIAKGHCTVEAIKFNKWTHVPVVFQDFEDEDQLYAYVQSDNAIANWSTLDLSGINLDLENLGPDLDITLLGIKNFVLDVSEFNPNEEWEGMPEFNQEDKTSFRRVLVHFKNENDVKNFFEIIRQSFTEKTKSIWHPKQENMDTNNRRYEDS